MGNPTNPFNWASFAGDIGTGFLNGIFGQLNADIQWKRQIEQWNRENQYNDPLAQRFRLQRAGFNPSAVSGDVAQSQAAGGLSSVPSNDVMASGLFKFAPIIEQLKTMAEIENIATNTELTSSRIATETYIQIAHQLGIRGKKLDNLRSELELKRDEMRTERYAEELDLQLKEIASRISKNDADANFATENANDLVSTRASRIALNTADADYKKALEQYTKDNNDRDARRLLIESAVARANIAVAEALAELHNANAEKALSDIDLNAARQGQIAGETVYLENKDQREAAIHQYDLLIADLKAKGMVTENQLAAYESQKQRLLAGDWHSVNDFAGWFYHWTTELFPF